MNATTQTMTETFVRTADQEKNAGDSDKLTAALSYAARGWYVFPCRESVERAKSPYSQHGLNDATTDAETIKTWWRRWPDAAIGLNCGRSGILAVDLDTKNGHDGLTTWAALGIDDAGALISQTPSGGKHIIFTSNGTQLGNTAGKLGDGIDTRGNGGYIILPPSRIIEGVRVVGEYKALGNWQTPPAVLPGALAALLTKSQAATVQTQTATYNTAIPGDPWAIAALNGECQKVATATEGTRNDTLNRAAFALGQIIGGGYLTTSEVKNALMTAAAACGLIAEDGKAATEKTIDSGLDAGMQDPRYKPAKATTTARPAAAPVTQTKAAPATTEAAENRPYKDRLYTDMGNAARFAAKYKGLVRYVAEWGWLLWDGERWQQDDAGAVMELAKETARALFDEARLYEEQAKQAISEIEKALAAGEDTTPASKQRDEAQRRTKEATGWAIKSQFKVRLEPMLALAQSDPAITARPDNFDTDPWLLNCENGVVDLRTGKLLPHDPAQLMTRRCPVVYDPGATCPTWDKFIRRIFDNDDAMLSFIQRAAGYSLTGSTKEQSLFFAYGNGANGKSVFTNTLLNIMGDYAQKTPIKMLTAHDLDSNGASPDLARLAGARLVIASEIEADRRLNESLVKDLTGGDRIAARFLRKEYFEFVPKFKLWIYGNHKPPIQGTDNGIWRRVKLIPFDVTIPESEQDQSLPEKLKVEYPGILLWLVTGCLAWVAGGLQEPQKVTQSTQDYRNEMDATGRFLEEQTIEGAAYWVAFAELYAAYLGWCADNGETPLNNRRFGDELTRRGFVADRGHAHAAIRRGLGLLTP